jgi:hypothetical protein
MIKFARSISPVVQWIVRRSPEPDIRVRFAAGLQNMFQIFFWAFMPKFYICKQNHKNEFSRKP